MTETSTKLWEGKPYKVQSILLEMDLLKPLVTLREKLLAYGGSETLFVPGGIIEYMLTPTVCNRLLERGQFWTGDARLKIMEPSQCHMNSKKLWNRKKGRIANGYALSSDGLWRPHSWVVDSKGIIETTELRLAYHGVILTDDEVTKEYE